MASEKLNMQIRLLRTALNYSQEELAKAVGVSDVTISKWESGRSPNSKHIPLLARALKCSETELLHGCKQQNPLPVEFSMNKKPMFSERLLSRMAMLELKSNDVAKAMHVSRGTVSQWVNGIAKPGGENAAHLAMILSCNIAWLMNGDGSVDDDAAMSTRQTHESVPLIFMARVG
ncbi:MULTISPECIES: helix-turn-helix domain-containing protein [unclassified Alishewanella]|uniref:helix-turn-helix domain-containing protein n=1 Tax=unclassified Alishewanella TaxID=2628974 RepID=UPI004042CC45